MAVEIIEIPSSPTAQTYLTAGTRAHRSGNLDVAADLYTQALRIDPECVEALINLSDLLGSRGKYMAAVACIRRAIANAPENPFLLAVLGNVLVRMEHYGAAVQVLNRAIELDPKQRGFWHTLGLAHMPTDPERSIECFKEAVKLGTEDDDTHPIRDLALAQFLVGRWNEGFENFVRGTRNGSLLIWASGIPEWRGQDLDGQTLLIHHEQGFGDTIQFCRYLRQISGHLILSVPAPLIRLFAETDLVDEVVCSLDPPPHADYQSPLWSALRYLDFEDRIKEPFLPYLTVPSQGPRVRRGPNTILAVGVCWSGSTNYIHQQRRSIPFEDLLSIADIPGVQLYSLQKGEATPDVRRAGGEALVPDLSGVIGDFADLAYVIDQLDLVVSVDTAALHLAGALGKPCIGLMRYNGCWRWGTRDADTTPFYQSMTLVRQEAPGDWVGVMIRVREKIAEILEASGG